MARTRGAGPLGCAAWLAMVCLAAPAQAGTSACPGARATAPLRWTAAAAANIAPGLQPPAPEPAAAGTYSQRLAPTPAGWPVRDHWCVWIEPLREPAGTAAALRERQWLHAVQQALAEWQQLLGITAVEDPDQAQVRIWRRRPPLQRLSDGRTRASNGRAVLQLLAVQRQQRWQAEPRVEVLIGTTQNPRALQATALHELGHAFGLWGHSDQSADAMAVQAGPEPVLRLSARDRQTMQWLLRQSGRLQLPPTPPESPAAARSPQPGPTAD